MSQRESRHYFGASEPLVPRQQTRLVLSYRPQTRYMIGQTLASLCQEGPCYDMHMLQSQWQCRNVLVMMKRMTEWSYITYYKRMTASYHISYHKAHSSIITC